MKRNIRLFISALLLAVLTLPGHAQTLLDEGFEDLTAGEQSDVFPEGWITENGYTGDNLKYRWSAMYSASGATMSGHYYAAVEAPTYVGQLTEAEGPREEKLLTPELDLNDTYQLSFDWFSAGASVFDKGEYTFQVRVINTATNEETTIWDYTNEEQVRNSGVPASLYNDYKGWLWDQWKVYNSKIDLSAFKGQKVKVAFVYVLKKQTGNSLYLDNVSVKQFTPFTSPIAQVDKLQYDFGKLYIGEKCYSEVFTLKNVGLKGLTITGFDAPAGIGLSAPADISLGVNETAQFQIYYTAALTTPADTKVTLKTNGGDVEIAIKAQKEVVPDGYTLELFEGEQFAPAGWSNVGWNSTVYALEGDKSAYSSGSFTDCYLTSPRLDLSAANAPRKVMFTYYTNFVNEDSDVPYNDLVVEASDNGGETWKELWVADYNKTDTLINVEVDLSAYTTDNVRVRWLNSAIEYNSETGADPYGTFFLDRVLLPNLYGKDGVPGTSELIAPADESTDVFTKKVVLQWSEAQFAEGYKLYVGKSEGTFDVINGNDLGDVTTYTIEAADYATKYYWKVVPYNTKGDATGAATWTFTTQADYSVTSFPWSEGFDGGVPPLGWYIDNDGSTRWSANTTYPFEGKASASANIRGKVGYASLCTPDVKLPAGSEMAISFWWGNDMCVNLTKDDSSVRTNEYNKENDGIDAGYFEIYADGEWKQLTMISNPNKENQYWVYESFDLAPYAGKTVAFRWRYVAENYSRCKGISLDNVTISGKGSNVALNISRWDAYKVNYGQKETSGTVAATNLGSTDATVKSVTFGTSNFSANLTTGTAIKSGSSVQFEITFDAGTTAAADSVKVDDTMTIELSDGNVLTLPVSGIALAKDIFFYGFEHDATGAAPAGLTAIDVDRQATSPISYWTTPNVGAPLSFFVINDSECYNQLKEPNGHQSLMTRCNTNLGADDWLVSPALIATAETTVQFDARSWESVNSILPESAPTFNVLVSETSPTETSSFTKVDGKTLDLYDNVAWTHLSYGLGDYAGKTIYIAIQATYSSSLGGFLDNVEYDHVTFDPTGIEAVSADSLSEADVTVYSLNGMKVASGKGAFNSVAKGIYMIKSGNRTVKVVKK